MEDALVEPLVVDKSENSPDKSPENSDKSENSEAPKAKTMGRPAGSKDKQKRVVKPRKITIVEEPVEPPPSSKTRPVAESESRPTGPSSSAAAVEPTVVERYIEHSPRTLMRHAHDFMTQQHHSKREARRSHWDNVILQSLR